MNITMLMIIYVRITPFLKRPGMVNTESLSIRFTTYTSI